MVTLVLDVIFRRIIEDAYLQMHPVVVQIVPVVVEPETPGLMRSALGGITFLIGNGVRAVPAVTKMVYNGVRVAPSWTIALAGAVSGAYLYRKWQNIPVGYFAINTSLFSRAAPVVAVPDDMPTRVAPMPAEELESVKDGSHEYSLTKPRCQCLIGTVKNGEFVVYGSAIRFDCGYLVAPDHVLSREDVYAKGSQGKVSLAEKDKITLYTDLSAVKMTEAEFSKIGISVCKIGTDPGVAYAQIVGPLGKGTTGSLKHDPTRFGRMIYEGTTLPGYSGSAYCVGVQVHGMHTNGGSVNGGYSASFIWAILRMEENMQPESSEDWLRNEFSKENRLKWAIIGDDANQVMVFIRGRYETHKTSTMSNMFGTNWQEEREILPKHNRDYGKDGFYDEEDVETYESASGEALHSVSGASSGLVNPQPQYQQNLQSLISGFNKLSPKQRKVVRNTISTFNVAGTLPGQIIARAN